MEFSREELSNRLLQEFTDEEDEELPEEQFGWNIKIMVPLIAAAVLGFMFFAWRADKIAISRNVGSEVPLVKADPNPVREKPDDPGGMYIANRDKQVYDAISSDSATKEGAPKVIRVLPEPEEPLTREVIKGEAPVELNKNEAAPIPTTVATEIKKELEPEAKSEPAKMEVAQNTPEKSEQKNPEVVVKQELMSKDIEIKAIKEESPKKEDKPAVKQITVNDLIKVTPASKSKTSVEPVKKNDNSYKIQLGSLRSEPDAKATWAKIRKEHGELLKGTEYYIEKADLGEKGIFYRLQANKIKSESDARKICQKLIESKQGCFVVKK